MTSKKCQGSSSGSRGVEGVAAPSFKSEPETNQEITPLSFTKKLSMIPDSIADDEEEEEPSSPSPRPPSPPTRLPEGVPPAFYNPFLLAPSLALGAAGLMKTEGNISPSAALDRLHLTSLLCAGLQRPEAARKPAITEALLANLPNLMPGGAPTPEAANLRFLLESINIAVTRSILEDNLQRLAGGGGGGLSGLVQQQQPWSIPDRGMRHNSYDSDGLSDEDTLYLEPDIEMEEEKEEKKSGRVRSLISEEQLSVLRSCYRANPMPRKEEMMEVADTVGHPYKVIKVWFQNSRARDRREGRQPVSYPTPPPSIGSMGSTPPPSSTRREHLPLDLTTKHHQLSPSVTPPPLIVALSESEPVHDDVRIKEEFREDVSTTRKTFEQMIRDKLVSLTPDREVAESLLGRTAEVDRPTRDGVEGGDGGRREEGDDQPGIYSCDQCDKTFTKKSSITRHKYEHSGTYNLLWYPSYNFEYVKKRTYFTASLNKCVLQRGNPNYSPFCLMTSPCDVSFMSFM